MTYDVVLSFPQKPLSKNEKATPPIAPYGICSAQRSPARRARTDTLFIVHLELAVLVYITLFCVLALIYIYIYLLYTHIRSDDIL